MINTFPDLLTFSFFAPSIIRIAAGLVFVYLAFAQWKRIEDIARMRFPIVGAGTWIGWVSVFFHAGIGAMLVCGFYTQIAALVGIVGLLKNFLLVTWYPHLMPTNRVGILLLIAICLSLLFSGAGAFAYDLPL
jgi:uncharacterized membrane protein YphA (DoxX/SURF4 family)